MRRWAEGRQVPWHGAMEATLFSAWIYDTLKPYAEQLVMGHPAKMKAITAGKKKSDRIDARMIADLLRCNLLPTCYVLPPELRDLRRLLRYRNLVVQQSVRMQNKMAGLLMESGTPFDKAKLHRKKYFTELMKSLQEVPESVKDLLRMSRGSMEMFQSTQKQLVDRLLSEPALEQRVERLMSIRAVGPITALTWALEIADPHRFASIADAVSYCGLTAAFRSSAGKQQRGPISKQRNAWLQSVLIEAAKLAPRWNPQLAALHAHALEARPSQPRDLASGAKTGGLPAGCGQERPALSGAHSASARKHEGEKQDEEKEQKGSRFGTSRLKANTPPVGSFALTVRLVKTEHAVVSFLRHADLSPDGHSLLLNTKGNLASQIPLRTHRWDESDRVFLAGCSSAEPASASSIHSAYQNFYVRSVSDPPAGPCVFRGLCTGVSAPNTPYRLFQGRPVYSHSIFVDGVSRRCSRKWMSGHAAIALVLLRDRGQFATLTICPLGEPVPPGQGESPFPVDFYLSWMSPKPSSSSARSRQHLSGVETMPCLKLWDGAV